MIHGSIIFLCASLAVGMRLCFETIAMFIDAVFLRSALCCGHVHTTTSSFSSWDSLWCQPTKKTEHTKLPCTHSVVFALIDREDTRSRKKKTKKKNLSTTFTLSSHRRLIFILFLFIYLFIPVVRTSI
jgi:hypothetical protein